MSFDLDCIEGRQSLLFPLIVLHTFFARGECVCRGENTMARRLYTAEEAAREKLMDDDSGEEEIDDDEDFELSSNSEDEIDNEDTGDAHTTFLSCMRNNRNMRASSTRGRGRIPRGRVQRPLMEYIWVDDEDFDPPNVPEFTANPGVKADINPDAPATAYFNLFVDDNLIEKMLEETNNYAEQAIRAKGMYLFLFSIYWFIYLL